ncbi:MAG: PTS sugar transporter subunit IIA [Planctomycetota bacterium]|jgi:mannitol/fructose-specific phosphotransferase system IIA component (Ntr-type)
MKLQDIVSAKAILPSLAASERDAAIAELVDALIDGGAVAAGHRDEFVKAIIRREKKGSTGFGHGVAVPHVKHADILKMVVAVGISREGIEFNALDGQPVYTLFLLLSPEESQEEHLDAMKAIFDFLSRETFRRFLRQATTVQDVLTLLQEADDEAMVR